MIFIPKYMSVLVPEPSGTWLCYRKGKTLEELIAPLIVCLFVDRSLQNVGESIRQYHLGMESQRMEKMEERVRDGSRQLCFLREQQKLKRSQSHRILTSSIGNYRKPESG